MRPDNVQRTSNGRDSDGPRTVHTQIETETVRTTSSRSAAQTRGRAEEGSLVARIRAIPEIDALTRLVASRRTDWAIPDIRRAIERDDRSWGAVVDAAWRASADPDVRHPNGLRYVGAGYDTAVPTLLSVRDALTLELCPEHEAEGFRAGACPLCRRGAA